MAHILGGVVPHCRYTRTRAALNAPIWYRSHSGSGRSQCSQRRCSTVVDVDPEDDARLGPPARPFGTGAPVLDLGTAAQPCSSSRFVPARPFPRVPCVCFRGGHGFVGSSRQAYRPASGWCRPPLPFGQYSSGIAEWSPLVYPAGVGQFYGRPFLRSSSADDGDFPAWSRRGAFRIASVARAVVTPAPLVNSGRSCPVSAHRGRSPDDRSRPGIRQGGA
jgi:hypothetical protein